MKSRIFVVLMLLNTFLSQGTAQDQSELNRLQEKFSRHVATKMRQWKHKRGESIEGSKNVVIEFWSFSNRVVKVSIIPHTSADEARQALLDFVRYDRDKEEIKGLGDNAYAWGYGLSNIVFRRGRLNVYVSTYAEVDSDPDARMLGQVERGERERLEMKRLSKEFAKHMVDAIDLP